MSTTEVVATTDSAARLGTRKVAVAGENVGPYPHLRAERERLDALTFEHFGVERLGATVGAELTGIDITRPLSDAAVAELRTALDAFKVIFFRDQPLTTDQHVAFAEHFGELEVHPFIPSNTGEPKLVRFEKSADVAGYENGWHHDVTWREIPSMGAVLHAIHVPARGGDTLFSDMHAAYDGLPDDVRDLIDDLDAVHDFMRAFSGQVPAGREQEFRDKYPLVRHPVAPVHPRTGRRYLYVNRFFTSHIDGSTAGLDEQESAELFDLLLRQAAMLEYQCRFHWRADSVAFWDNHAVQHYAASDYWPDVRVMERASIVGHRPSR
jgi:alpha-ketoglutarate-dependent taurine dioxygenase